MNASEIVKSLDAVCDVLLGKYSTLFTEHMELIKERDALRAQFERLQADAAPPAPEA